MKSIQCVIHSKGERSAPFIHDESDLDELCRDYDIDFERLLYFVEDLPDSVHTFVLDVDTMHKNNFGRYKNMTEARHLDIQYITEKPVKVQAVKVTRENIYYVAEWVGAKTVHTPVRKNVILGEREEPSFSLPGGPSGHFSCEVTVGHWVVRDKKGHFSRMSETEVKHRFDFPETEDSDKKVQCKVPLNSHVPMNNTCVLDKDHDGAHRTWGLGWNLITFESANRKAWNSGL